MMSNTLSRLTMSADNFNNYPSTYLEVPMKTTMVRKEDVTRNWFLVDAAGKRVGRVAVEVANVLRGKNKPTFTPHVDTGDFVVVINTDKLELTGNKWESKKYYRHSRFFGSMKETKAAEMKEKNSPFIIEDAVKGMLPKNKLARNIIKKLKVYPGAEHPHSAQKPELLDIKVK